MTTTPPSATNGVPRRTVLGGAAWAVPAIVMVTTSPAYAVSITSPSLTVTAPNMQTVAAGTTTITALLKDSNGQPLSGQPVSFTGPTGTSFTPATPTTDGSGIATTTLTTTDTWATPGSTLTVTGTSNGTTGTAPLSVLGANAYSVGENTSGQLGNGTTASPVATPVQLPLVFPSPLRSVASGTAFSLALLTDGTVWSTGDNTYGQLGDGTRNSRTTWARIPALSGVASIAAGHSSAYAVLSTGGIRAWGWNAYGQLGDGTQNNRTAPVVVANVNAASEVTAGYAIAYALSGGRVSAWGMGHVGQLGNATDARVSIVPVSVSSITTATAIAAGANSAYALLSDGTVRSWGYNLYGQLGDGTTTNRNSPVSVADVSNATQIAAGDSSGYAAAGGQVYGWGVGTSFELGGRFPGPGYASTRVTVPNLTGVQNVSARSDTGFVIAGGTVRSWGSNQYGEVGDGTTTPRRPPATVTAVSNVTALATSSCGGHSMFFLR